MIVGPATKPQRGSRSCNRTHTHTHTNRAVRIGLAGTLGFAGLGLMAMAAPPVSHDFNADGANDYPVSVTGFDPATPVNGAARMWSGASKAVIDTIVNPDTNTLFGWSIGSAGDLDADGFDDLIVGEPLWGPDGSLRGRVQVFSGDDSSVLLSAAGPYWETGLGRYVAGIGDWNGDAVLDLAVSGWDIADTNSDGIGDDAIGIVFVLSGADGSVLTEIIEPTATALFGYSVFGLGDITGDGLADIAVVDRGAPGAPGSGAIGQLYIFAGRAAPGALTAADAHRTIANADPTLRGFAAQVDTMHPDLWLDEPTLQIISLTSNGVGGPNQAETAINIRKINGQPAGTKGLRPTLVLAGDINLDGKVNALDLQESIAQLGTNPQATGVMPIADLNEDSIIDLLDVALLLDGYGGETDIYEGLWDGSRLLAVVGGSAGFGSIGGGSIGGNWGLEPGRRPIDGCLRSMPDDGGQGLVPALLRQDGQINCNDCPACGLPDPLDCFKCNGPGRIEGGQITATPDQPMLGDTVVFSWDNFIVTGRSDQCGPPCNGNQACDLADYVLQGDKWYIDKKDPMSGQWIVPPYKRSHDINGVRTNDQPTIFGEACGEYRFRLESGVVGPRDSCPGLPSVTKEKEVQFADFTLCYETTKAAPDGTVRRTRIGILEEVTILTDQDVSVEWAITFEDGRQEPRSGSSTSVTAGSRAGSIKVEASANDCVRRLTIEVVEPDEVMLHHRDGGDQHAQGVPTAGMLFCVEILPNDVSFEGLTVGEKFLDGYDSVTGYFELAGWADRDHPRWTQPVLANNYLPGVVDSVTLGIHPQNFAWYQNHPGSIDESVAVRAIPWFFEDLSRQDPQVVFDTLVSKKTLLIDGTTKVEKDGEEVSFALNAPDTNLDLPTGWVANGCNPGIINREEGCNDE